MITAERRLAALKLVFTVAMVGAFATAISPLAVETGVDQGDKVMHILAFYGLTLLGAAGFPRVNLLLLLAGMSVYGALIEVAQGLSFIGRDRDIIDWVADTAASAAALIPLALGAWRTRWKSDAPRN